MSLGLLVPLSLASCVPLSELPPGSVPLPPSASASPGGSGPRSEFQDIDPGGTQLTTLHFTVRGYTENQIRPISIMAENLYNKISNDTGLYTYMASGSYKIVVYKDQDEYGRKTHMPAWSRAVAYQGVIYLYPGPDLQPVLAHEMTHLVFNSFLGERLAQTYRWLNEGLAMVEEISEVSETERLAFQSDARKQLREKRMTFSQMSFFVPANEERRRVDAWYEQVYSVTSYLLAQGSALNFAGMLNSLKNGIDMDRALADNYPGKFNSQNELETAWKYTL